eukprot:gene29499-5846_t
MASLKEKLGTRSLTASKRCYIALRSSVARRVRILDSPRGVSNNSFDCILRMDYYEEDVSSSPDSAAASSADLATSDCVLLLLPLPMHVSQIIRILPSSDGTSAAADTAAP